MDREILNLLQLNVEMEGLLRVLAERDNASALDVLARKASDFDAAMRAFLDGRLASAEASGHAGSAAPQDGPASGGADARPEEIPAAEPVQTSVHRYESCGQRMGTRPRMDLSKAFSLNDRYRYSRELFGGDMQRFLDALGVMSGMDSFASVPEYLAGTLGLDLSEPVARELADRIADNMPK